MSKQQRIRRTALALLATGFGAGWAITVLLVLLHPSGVDLRLLMPVVWVSGLAALVLTVAACRVADDSTDDPAYFGSIVRGIRAEWQRPTTRR